MRHETPGICYICGRPKDIASGQYDERHRNCEEEPMVWTGGHKLLPCLCGGTVTIDEHDRENEGVYVYEYGYQARCTSCGKTAGEIQWCPSGKRTQGVGIARAAEDWNDQFPYEPEPLRLTDVHGYV